jgi:putative membrane protein
MMKAYLAYGAAAMLLASPLAAQAPATTKASGYVPAAGASDLYEKTSSQMVLKDARNPQVRAFAQMMVTDHSQTTAQVKAAAQASGIKVAPPKLMPKQSAMIAQLKAASTTQREKIYLTQQVTAHEEALALHQGYAANGDKPALKKVAATAVPIVQKHLEQVRRLNSTAQ